MFPQWAAKNASKGGEKKNYIRTETKTRWKREDVSMGAYKQKQ